MKTKILWAITGVSLVCCGILAFNTWTVQKENQKLAFLCVIYEAEHRILKDEIADKENRPTYDQGYKNALIRIGGPQQPGAYQDGWDDAMKVIGTDSNYADGYHAAIQQFGYTKNTATARWMVPEPKSLTNDKKSEGTPTKLEKDKK